MNLNKKEIEEKTLENKKTDKLENYLIKNKQIEELQKYSIKNKEIEELQQYSIKNKQIEELQKDSIKNKQIEELQKDLIKNKQINQLEAKKIIRIDRESNLPVYKQIYSEVVKKINEGIFNEKDKLPTDRELSEQLNIARGTVKKAYEHLISDGYITRKVGDGTYISNFNSNKSHYLKSDLMKEMFEVLVSEKYTYKEIDFLYNIAKNLKEDNKKINILIVDCNQEALITVKRKFKTMENANIMLCEFKELYQFRNVLLTLSSFDMIITTENHYLELCSIIPTLKDKIVKVVLSVASKSVAKLVGIKDPTKTGIITKSKRFGDIIDINLRRFSIEIPTDNFITSEKASVEDMIDFIRKKDAIIIPPIYAADINLSGEAIFDLAYAGKSVIVFKYTIEDGSVIHVEEKVKKLLEDKGINDI
ncbi:MAG: GntR family transcriptional regulator [Clostridioides sp.]|jgi:DNA-binding transcriptional regulator YhcF (GntR family)|nr:GntR family transcriptional regulator [Clostridioides sp.]